MAERRQHPSLSDVALALATRQRSERSAKATVSNANAKGAWQVTVEVNDPDPEWVLKTIEGMTDFLVAKYAPPENGAAKPEPKPKPKPKRGPGTPHLSPKQIGALRATRK